MSLKEGDYCLATKWSDGWASDHWAVGFYEGEIYPGRHSVTDADGNRFRANGFRRCEVISQEQGGYLLKNAKELELCGAGLWNLLPRIGQSPFEATMLSSRAQAVLAAANQAYEEAGTVAEGSAAALRAAVDQVECDMPDDNAFAAGYESALADIASIAAELKAHP